MTSRAWQSTLGRAIRLAAPVTVIVLLDRVRLPVVGAPLGILSPAVVDGRNPYDDYLRFGLIAAAVSLALSVVCVEAGAIESLMRRTLSSGRRPVSPTTAKAVGLTLFSLSIGVWIATAASSINPSVIPSDFDNAEQVSWLPAWLHSTAPPSQFLLIHGPGVDVLMSLIARTVSPDTTIWLTRVLMACVVAFAAASAVWLLNHVINVPGPRDPTSDGGAPEAAARHLFLAASVTTLLFLAPPGALHAALLVLIPTLAMAIHVASGPRTVGPREWLAGFGLGLTIPFGIAWSYQFGLVGLASAVLSGVILAISSPRPVTVRVLTAAGLGVVVAFAGLWLVLGTDALVAIASHIQYWASAGLWSWELDLLGHQGSALLTINFVVAAATLGGAITAILRSMLRLGFIGGVRRQSTLIVLTGAFALASRDLIERTDATHVERTLALALIVVAATLVHSRAHRWFGRLATDRLALMAVGEVVVLVLVWTAVQEVAPLLMSVQGFAVPDRSDGAVLGPERSASGADLSEAASDSHCTVILSSSPLPLYASDLPPCGPFAFAPYARTASSDARLAQVLDDLHPPVVMDEVGTGAVDGLTSASITPQAMAVVLDHYRPDTPRHLWIWTWSSVPLSIDPSDRSLRGTAQISLVAHPAPDSVTLRPGTEVSVIGSVPARGLKQTEDSVYLSIDGDERPVSAAAFRVLQAKANAGDDARLWYSVPLPTRGLETGRHTANVWVRRGDRLTQIDNSVDLSFVLAP